LIEWLLEQVEKDPTTLFRKRDLLKKSPFEFERLKQAGLLTYVQSDPENETYPCDLPCARACARQIVEMQGQFYAICPEDSEITPILLGEDDLHKYALSIEKLLEEIRKANGLGGSISRIEPDYSYVGHILWEERRVGFVFVPSIKGKRLLELCGLRKQCLDDDVLIVFSLVSAINDISIRVDLSREKIVQASLAATLDLGTLAIPVAELVTEAIEAERDHRPAPQTRVPGDKLISLTEAAGLLGMNKGTVGRLADAGRILDNEERGKNRRVWKSSVLLLKQRQEDEQLLQEVKDLRIDSERISDRY